MEGRGVTVARARPWDCRPCWPKMTEKKKRESKQDERIMLEHVKCSITVYNCTFSKKIFFSKKQKNGKCNFASPSQVLCIRKVFTAIHIFLCYSLISTLIQFIIFLKIPQLISHNSDVKEVCLKTLQIY